MTKILLGMVEKGLIIIRNIKSTAYTANPPMHAITGSSIKARQILIANFPTKYPIKNSLKCKFSKSKVYFIPKYSFPFFKKWKPWTKNMTEANARKSKLKKVGERNREILKK